MDFWAFLFIMNTNGLFQCFEMCLAGGKNKQGGGVTLRAYNFEFDLLSSCQYNFLLITKWSSVAGLLENFELVVMTRSTWTEKLYQQAGGDKCLHDELLGHEATGVLSGEKSVGD